MTLRAYQSAAADAVDRELASRRSTLVVMATGTGKTVLFAELARRWRAAKRQRVLVIAHREELIEQAKDKIERFAGLSVGIEMGERRVAAMLFGGDVVVGSVQTLQNERRRAAYAPDAFSHIVVDEAHHAPAASYRGILGYFAGAKILGVTATPDRGDGVAMGQVFESVAFTYGLRDAIDEGYLAPIRQKAVHVDDLDLSQVRTTAGDLNEGDLERVLTEERNLHGVASPLVQLAGDRPTIVFAASIAHAHALAEVITRHAGRPAVALDGSADRAVRKRVVSEFTAGKFQYLINCALFTEGFDAPPVRCVAVARPTKSRSLYEQMIGRGTRLFCDRECEKMCSHDGAKRDLLVLDFEGNAAQHRLVTAVDVLGGKEPPDVLARAREISAQLEMPVHQVIDEARAQLAAEKKRKVIARARYQAIDIDPFDGLGLAPRVAWWSSMAPTQYQSSQLVKVGLDPRAMSRAEAEAIVNEIGRRARLCLARFDQAVELAKHGLNPDVHRREATRLLDVIKSNGGRVPDWLRGRQEEPQRSQRQEGGMQ